MQKLSNNRLIALVNRLLLLLLAAKIISVGVWWYLPSEGVELAVQTSHQPPYQRGAFTNMLIDEKKSSSAQAGQKRTQSAQGDVQSIDSLWLHGLYGSRFNGYAIIAKKSAKNDTTIIAVGEEYAGYTLKEIELRGVILTKASKNYRLELEQGDDAKLGASITPVQHESSEESTQKEVKRSDILAYANNPSQIWKDIGIMEKKEGGKLVGFTVTRVKRGSKMAMLGLKRGDLIIKANNRALTSISEVLKFYKQIDKIDTLALTVLRDNQEKEIVYEIR